jgi:type I restriction enzyme R subunit
MVLLAKWILENMPKARVLILTDRDELEKQIKPVFEDSGEEIHRSSSGRDLMTQLGQPLGSQMVQEPDCLELESLQRPVW